MKNEPDTRCITRAGQETRNSVGKEGSGRTDSRFLFSDTSFHFIEL
jgi:hypothetical protein